MGIVLTAEQMEPAVSWGSPIEHEVRRRIQVCVGAYAYEIADAPIMTDAQWDWLAARVDRWLGTGHPLLDEFFVTQFSPMTAMWIHHHPDLDGVKKVYERYYRALQGYYSQPSVQARLAR